MLKETLTFYISGYSRPLKKVQRADVLAKALCISRDIYFKKFLRSHGLFLAFYQLILSQ